MSNPQGGRGNSLGLAVGATNLASTGEGHRPVIRPASVALQPGLTLTGFVDRVGDPVPMVAADGSQHRPETLLAEALDGVARSAAMAPVSEVAVAVPAHWRPPMVDALRDALHSKPGLARSPLVPDATAALTALRANPGLPSTGVVVLCDFGGSGASITVVDAAAKDAPIGDTVRVPDFSGDQIDQAVLSEVVAGIFEASDADPAGTAMVGSLARHEALNARMTTVMGADNEGRMHVLMGQRYARCIGTGTPAGGSMGPGMMGSDGWNGGGPWSQMMGTGMWSWMSDGHWQQMSSGDWQRLGGQWMGPGMMRAGGGRWSAADTGLVIGGALILVAAAGGGLLAWRGRRGAASP